MWDPIGAEFEDIARAAISQIARDLGEEEKRPLSPSDLCEHALLYSYLYLAEFDGDWYERSETCLNQAIDRLNSEPAYQIRSGLHGGLAGFGWMVQHVASILSETADIHVQSSFEDEVDPLTNLDSRLLNADYPEAAAAYTYDLIGGPVGIGVYWLERLPRPAAAAGLRKIVQCLKDCSELTRDGRTWFTKPSEMTVIQRELAPEGYYNMGVAHGVAGVIGLLAQVVSYRIDDEITELSRSMLEETVSWVLAQSRPEPALTQFSSWIAVGQPRRDSGTGWCYGDLGIGTVLLLAAKLLDNPTWNDEAHKLLTRHMATKSNGHIAKGAGEARDAGLCHGAIGIAHLFNRIYHSTQNTEYRQAAIDAVWSGFSLRKEGVGPGGFYAWNSESFPHEHRSSRFLPGALGIALALISIVAPIEPSWDRLLLLSTVPKTNAQRPTV